MATDLDPILTESLRDRAGRDIDPAPIVRAAVARGARLRRRRQAATTAAAVAVVGMVATAAVGLPRREAAPVTVPLQTDVAALRLPLADGVPGAAERPDLVSTDPQILHFAVDGIITAQTRKVMAWGRNGAADGDADVGDGSEAAEVLGDDRRVHVALGRSPDGLPGPLMASVGLPFTTPEAIDVNGLPGTVQSTGAEPAGVKGLGHWVVLWQPAGGLWARVHAWTATRDEAVAAAAGVSFDSARRCALPFRLPSMSAGGTVKQCELTMGTDSDTAFQQGEVEMGDGPGRTLMVRARLPRSAAERTPSGSITAGPYRVQRLSSFKAYGMVVRPYYIEAIAFTGRGREVGYSEQEALTELGGLRTVGDPDDPSSW